MDTSLSPEALDHFLGIDFQLLPGSPPKLHVRGVCHATKIVLKFGCGREVRFPLKSIICYRKNLATLSLTTIPGIVTSGTV